MIDIRSNVWMVAVVVAGIALFYAEDNIRQQIARQHAVTLAAVVDQQAIRKEQLKTAVLAKYSVDENLVDQVIDHALTYERDVFPRAEHIVAVVGIESSWRPNVKSKLKRDPAVGLTQIRPRVWSHRISDPKLLNSVENQIKFSADILSEYYGHLKNEASTIIAYNAGLTAFLKNRYNQRYLVKFNHEMSYLSEEK